MAGAVKVLKQKIVKAKSYEDVGNLGDARKQLDQKGLGELLARTIFLANLFGRWQVEKERKKDA